MATTETQAPGTVQGEVRMLIDGELVEAASGKRFDNINPATEEVLGQVADASAEDMQRAIAAARRAADETDWSTNHQFRKQCLLQLHEAIESEKEELRHELVAEVGCPIGLTYGPQLDAPLSDALMWPAEFIDQFEWERDLPDNYAFGGHSTRKVVREAAGVVGAIVPWNYPFEVSSQKIGQALATGNTVILKPAPDTPWNATRLGRLALDKTDIPAGVFQVVTSSDHLVGEELVTSPLVDLISFTGSTATGKRIFEKGSATMKRLFLELGGKSADIVLDDANLEGKMGGACFIAVHGGQGCVMATRMLVPRKLYDKAIEIAAPGFESFPYGDPNDMGNLMGPLVSAKQRDRVLGYIEKGKEEGARVVVGGGKPAHLDQGWYVEPTLFADVDNNMTIAREEIFGPVLIVIPFEDDDDAVRLANDNQYGLGGYVTSGSVERAMAVGRRLKAGTISINGGAQYGADAPFGGYKASGVGRQNGREGFQQYTEVKTYAVGVPQE
ncbi:MAG TPA: aldehyde dehydrogenase family protein [Acidimicrobiia bacterium]|jgi:aldehyde dehydrogenase (NAD+)